MLGMINGLTIDTAYTRNFRTQHPECHELRASWSLRVPNVVANITQKKIWTFYKEVNKRNTSTFIDAFDHAYPFSFILNILKTVLKNSLAAC